MSWILDYAQAGEFNYAHSVIYCHRVDAHENIIITA